jgi:murein L,D-transpeptidase YafK
MNPHSQFHLSFNLGFPNAYDRARGRTGSYLMVHGNCVSIGCYAMTNARIEEIYTLALASFVQGQKSFPVHIFPYRMTEENLAAYGDKKWLPFWRNLKQGYDFFEQYKKFQKFLLRQNAMFSAVFPIDQKLFLPTDE